MYTMKSVHCWDAEASIGENHIKLCKLTFHDPTVWDKVFIFSGSVVEGAMMARCFQKKKEWKELETDIMINIFRIPQEVSHLLELVEDKPGFVRLPFCQKLCPEILYKKYVQNLKVTYVPYSLDQLYQYISPLIIREGVKAMFVRAANADPRACFMHDLVQSLCNLKERESKTETTLEVNIDMHHKITNESICHYSTDIVPAVHLNFWPHQAANWITRRRLWWPLQGTIQSVVNKGCQLVPRSSPGGDVHSEWRLSFSGAEAILSQLRSKKQQEAYYFFKMFFYRYLKCVGIL